MRKQQLAAIQQANPDISLDALQDVETILLNPTWLKDFSKSVEKISAPSFSLPSPQELLEGDGPSAAVKDAEEVFNKISDIFKKLEQEIKDSLKDNNEADIEAYEEILTAYFFNGYTNTSGNRKYTVKASSEIGMTDWQSKVLESILSRNNEGFFSAANKAKYKQNFQNISGEKAKLLAIIKVFNEGREPVLKYINKLVYSDDSSKRVTVRHQKTTQSKTLNNSLEVLEELFKKINKYYQQLNAVAAEAAVGEALEQVLEDFKKRNEEFELSIGKNIGNRQLPVKISRNFKGNKKLFEKVKVKGNKSAWERAATRVSKSDASFEVSSNGVKVSQGITVKDYREYSINPKLNSASIDLQRGTPLLTLLTREAYLNPAKMHMLYQILSAHPTTEDSGDENPLLVETWNNIVQKAQYLAFLDTLAGFTNERDQAFYFVFDRKIYSLIDVLSYLQRLNDYNDVIRWSDIEGNNGLEYSTYHNLDKWIGTRWQSDSKLAEARSEATTTYISQQMYDTKIRVKLHIADLAAFAKLAL